MQQKNTNSKKYDQRKGNNTDQNEGNEDDLENFHSDEEAENFESQKEDMKAYLNKLNSRIDTLVSALKEADSMIAKQTDQKNIMEQIKERKANGARQNEQQSIAQYFKE